MLFLVILAPLPLPAKRRIVSVPFRSVNTYLLVEASDDGRPVTLPVDTGAKWSHIFRLNNKICDCSAQAQLLMKSRRTPFKFRSKYDDLRSKCSDFSVLGRS